MNLRIYSKYKYIQDFAIKAAYYLKLQDIDAEIDISVKKSLTDEAQGYCIGDREEVEILLARNSCGQHFDKKYILSILAHEMVHAKQFLKGELKDTIYDRSKGYYVFWKGKKMLWDDNTDLNPWEQDAYNLEKEVFSNCYK
jgi:hypothetical protein